jgi:hypothetical protein
MEVHVNKNVNVKVQQQQPPLFQNRFFFFSRLPDECNAISFTDTLSFTLHLWCCHFHPAQINIKTTTTTTSSTLSTSKILNQ